MDQEIEDKIKEVEATWISAKGRKEYIRYLRGDRLTMKEKQLAKCMECCHGYGDGKIDCIVATCPLYHDMPYREAPPLKRKRKATEKQLKALEKAREAQKR